MLASILEQRLNGDRALGLRLIKIFMEDTPPKLADLEKALAAEDLPEARRLAHALSGSAAVIGVQEMHTTFRQLESECQNKDLNLARISLPKAEKIYADLEEELRQVIAIWSQTPAKAEGTAEDDGSGFIDNEPNQSQT